MDLQARVRKLEDENRKLALAHAEAESDVTALKAEVERLRNGIYDHACRIPREQAERIDPVKFLRTRTVHVEDHNRIVRELEAENERLEASYAAMEHSQRYHIGRATDAEDTLEAAQSMANEWKNRADDAGRLSRAVLGIPAKGGMMAYVTCSKCHHENKVDELTPDEINTIASNVYEEDTLTFTCRECGEEVTGIVWARR